ncbi:MAG: methyltransferase domain-containing protein [Paracoccaceae bacterium]
MSDWNPASYGRFAGLRLRPAIDLLAHVPRDLPQGAIVDLGCGNGAVGPALAEAWPKRERIGIDTSATMLCEAEEAGTYTRLTRDDIADWQPDGPAALIFSNAALHWLPDHAGLIARLAGSLAPGGVLAVQMPRQFGAPSHRFLREFAAEMFPDRFDFAGWRAPVMTPVEYLRLLAPLGQANVWETDYIQRLGPAPDGHPVRRFTEATAMRPFLARLSEAETEAFLARYEAALGSAYPVEADGGVLFPFRRLFFTLRREGYNA